MVNSNKIKKKKELTSASLSAKCCMCKMCLNSCNLPKEKMKDC